MMISIQLTVLGVRIIVEKLLVVHVCILVVVYIFIKKETRLSPRQKGILVIPGDLFPTPPAIPITCYITYKGIYTYMYVLGSL